MNRALFVLPLVLALIIGLFSLWGLSGGRNPSEIPSALISKQTPEFDLGPIEGVDTPGMTHADLAGRDDITLVNFFASWCGPCRAEHPVLTRMAEEQNLRLVAINYKDKPEAATDWLAEMGNPYELIGSDYGGRTSIDWGISGVPETFIVDKDGVIVYRLPGPAVGDGRRRLQEAIDQARAAQ